MPLELSAFKITLIWKKLKECCPIPVPNALESEDGEDGGSLADASPRREVGGGHKAPAPGGLSTRWRPSLSLAPVSMGNLCLNCCGPGGKRTYVSISGFLHHLITCPVTYPTFTCFISQGTRDIARVPACDSEVEWDMPSEVCTWTRG